MMQDEISTDPNAPRQGAALVGPQDLVAAARRMADGAAGGGRGGRLLRAIYYPLLWMSLRVGPAPVWIDANRQLVVGLQNEAEYRANIARTRSVGLLVTFAVIIPLVIGENTVLAIDPVGGSVIVFVVLSVLIGFMIFLLVRQTAIRASTRAMRAVKKLKPFFVVSCVSLSPDVTRDEAVRFLHEVISARTVGGEYLRIYAFGEEQASFFESLGFQRLEGTWALIGQAPSVRE
ncbi:hypothetical protein QFZ52_000103 [Arthrobacter woluwensis]|uniref:hypothetical protein n=1 Tax=Arthrobacter woluwensis TaxID=156980 RepID=UPI00278773D2|nr:hypothetical protein [Arthrobacter woluwensis]MDQ0707451.1 hypothetical protein [Arthrobacter woluwensis]